MYRSQGAALSHKSMVMRLIRTGLMAVAPVVAFFSVWAAFSAEKGSKAVPVNTAISEPVKKLAIMPGRKPLYVERFNIEHYLLEGEGEPRWTNGEIPAILSESDVSRYRVVFRVQQEGEWRLADKIIPSIENPILMGHVLAQRYLHPTKYRSNYSELRAWMKSYADHPNARRIYKLALKRRPTNWKMPKAPTLQSLTGSGHDGRIISYRVYNPRKKLNRVQRREMRGYERQLRFFLRKGWTLAYKRLINKKRVKKLFHSVQLDKLRANLAAGYFAAGRDDWALDWADKAAKRSGKYLPEAHWTAAMASWRLAHFKQSLAHFDSVARSEYASPWLVSAGAFWAARASIKIRKPQEFNRYLEIAAEHPRTFYGLLGSFLLDRKVTYNWTPPPLAKHAVSELAGAPGGRRAVTLLQVGEDRRAERELRIVFSSAKPELARAMLALADRADMPSLAMRLGNLLVSSSYALYDSTAYPAPALHAPKNAVIDRELILAIVRQESGFNPRAKSHRGARGLMQLMPGTASFVAKDRKFRSSKRKELFNPETNLALGQRYIDILLQDKRIKGDLFRMTTAWNAGPGNLNKWSRKVEHGDDPLLFIESIPAKETRIFVERVLTNYWVYRSRFGKSLNSLEAVASGKWPIYRSERSDMAELAGDVPQREKAQ